MFMCADELHRTTLMRCVFGTFVRRDGCCFAEWNAHGQPPLASRLAMASLPDTSSRALHAASAGLQPARSNMQVGRPA